MANAIGIDFGTTKTMVSYLNPATGRPELVRLGRDRDSIPTTVHVDEVGAFLFGEDADDQIEMDPEGYCRAFKLHLGEKEAVLPRSGITAEALTARFLQHIKDECEQSVFHGDPVSSATITIPVSFSPARKASLKRAAETAGFAKVSFLPEPEAAGIAFLRDNPQDKFSRALVLDWGGGTLDIAIISRDKDGTIHADRHSVEGRDDMGGEEIDRGFLQNINAFWETSNGEPLIKDEMDEVRFLRVAQKVKEQLTRKETVSFRSGQRKQDITREQFSYMIHEFLDEAVRLVVSALGKNKGVRGGSEPDALILIGGSCQIPAVRHAMEQNFPKLRVLSWHHSHEAVALGATAVCNAEGVDLQNNFDRRNVNMPPPVPDAFRREVTYNAVPIKQQRCWKSGTALEGYIRESKIRHEDVFYFLRATIVAGWRLNAIQTSALALADELEKIGENEDSTVISIRIRQGLNAIAFGEFDDIVKTIADAASEMIGNNSDSEAYVELYPQLKSISMGSSPLGINEKSFKKDIEKQLRQLQGAYNDICCKYNMLCEGFARYDKILAGGSFWKKVLLGGVLGWLTGGLGVIAAVAWDGWKGMSNKDFAQNYSSAIQDFLTTCDAFTDQGQELLSQIVMSRQDLWNQSFAREEVYLRALNAEGIDLDVVEKRMAEKVKHEWETSGDVAQLSQMFALALQLLKQDAPISESRIKKIVGKLRMCGALLSVDGTFDEAAAQALIPTDPSGDDTADRFQQIVGTCAHFDDFYILDAIPNDKLVTALHDYGNGMNEENVLCLYDSTFFGGGGDGFIIAPGGICSKQLGCDPCAWTWEDMKSIKSPDGSGNVVKINGVDVDVPQGGAGEFAKMFRKLKKLLGSA